MLKKGLPSEVKMFPIAVYWRGSMRRLAFIVWVSTLVILGSVAAAYTEPSEIFLYDGTGVSQLTDNSYYNDTSPEINNTGYVVWRGEAPTEYGWGPASVAGAVRQPPPDWMNHLFLLTLPLCVLLFWKGLRGWLSVWFNGIA
jgi:hypothetical protein